MKKIIVFVSSILFSLTSFSWEIQLKGGYDVYRYGFTTKKAYENGFILNIEYIHFNRGVFEIGAGAEYNFGNSNVFYNTEDNNKNGYMAPLYLLGKINYFRTDNNKIGVYSLTRLGYAFASNDVTGKSYDGGFYYGLGLGFEIDNFVMESIYDGKYTKNNLMHKIGFRTGIRFGNYEKRIPNIEVKNMDYFINYVPPKQEIISY